MGMSGFTYFTIVETGEIVTDTTKKLLEQSGKSDLHFVPYTFTTTKMSAPTRVSTSKKSKVDLSTLPEPDDNGQVILPMYEVPGDDHKTFRREAFKDYYKVYSYFDPSISMLCHLSKLMQLDEEQRIWMSLIYSATYSAATTYLFLLDFPRYNEYNKDALDKWWIDNKSNLICQSDRRYVKNNNMFVPIILDYTKKVGDNQKKFFESLFGETKQETYHNIYKFVKKLKYYGRFSVFLFMEALYNLTDIDMDCDVMEWKQGSTATQGLAHIIYRDDIVERSRANKLTKQDCEVLDEASKQLIVELRKFIPERELSIWDIESAYCGYRKLYKQTRYLTYYTDRELDELTKMTNMNPLIDWTPLWDFRKTHILPQFLGEESGWGKPRPELCSIFMETGKIWNEPLPDIKFVDLCYPKNK